MKEPQMPSDEIRLLEWANVLLRHRLLIVFLTVAAAGIAYGLCRLAEPLYTAETRIISDLDAQMVAWQRVVGLDIPMSAAQTRDRMSLSYVSGYYAELLTSEELLAPLVGRAWSGGLTLAAIFELKESPAASLERQAMALLRKEIIETIQSQATGMLTIRCTTPVPELSAEIANTLADRLQTYLGENRTSTTSQLLHMAADSTSQAQTAMANAIMGLRDFRQRNKAIVSPDLQLALEDRQRDVALREEIFVKLRTQLELLRLIEQQPPDMITVLQPAQVPARKSWPPTRAAVAGAAVFGFLLALLIGFVRQGIRAMFEREAPGYAEFAEHIRALNRLLPGLVLLLPAESRRRRAARPRESLETPSPTHEVKES